jgi:hypothetical protein
MSGFSTFFSNLWGTIKSDLGGTPTISVPDSTDPSVLYAALAKDAQEAGTFASGALAIVNANIKINSALLIPIIQSVFPNTSLDDITTFFTGIAATLVTDTSKIPTTLADAITTVQTALSAKQGNAWIVAVQGLVNLGATLLSPETEIQKFVSVAEFVYQDIITPLLGLHKSTPIVAPILPVVAPIPPVPAQANGASVLPNGQAS